MGYTFRQILLPSSKYKLKAPYAMTAQYITVHNTANDAPAINEVTYHNNNNNEVSFHVAIDDKEAIQCIPFNRNAFHAGDGGDGNGNRKSIGIEICYSKSGGSRYEAAEENAVHYIADLLFERGWGIDRIKKHQDWSGKNCPHRILNEGRWESFKQRVQQALNNLKHPQVKGEMIVMDLLNPTGRVEAKEMIKRGVEEKLFTSKHEGMDKYSDAELIGYAVAYMNRKTKQK